MIAALQLADFNLAVALVEKRSSLGGHAAMFSCKATDRCVECGACLVEQTIDRLNRRTDIEVLLESSIDRYERDRTGRLKATIRRGSAHRSQTRMEVDSIVLATGFQTYDPTGKPFGYGRFPNVLTALELERMLRIEGRVKKPSDGGEPDRIAFIQCVGSREAALGHPWCSKICCASSLRMANRIKWDRSETEITIFYIDIQTFGRSFDSFYEDLKKRIRFIRTIPGDILPAGEDLLTVPYFDGEAKEETFDLLVLSAGMMPDASNSGLLRPAGFCAVKEMCGYETASLPLGGGVFVAGAMRTPMNIADAAADGLKAAGEVIRYLASTTVAMPEELP